MKALSLPLLTVLFFGLGCQRTEMPPKEEKVAEIPAPVEEPKPEPKPEPVVEEKPKKEAKKNVVTLKTSKGDIRIELYPDKAPKTVANFLQYVEDGHYKGAVFHRVIPNFMVQGGGFDKDLKQKATRANIENEADNGVKNERGTVAMARTPEPHSASAQFFINVKDNEFLNHTGKNPRGWGYCVFGKVTEGMDVVDAIVSVETAASGPFPSDVPVETIEILDATTGD